MVSDDQFFLSQLDNGFEATYTHLTSPCRVSCAVGIMTARSARWSTRTATGWKAIGAPLLSLNAVQDLPVSVQQRLYFLRLEDLMARPAACMTHLHAWLGLSPHAADPQNLTVGIRESDSHYRMKYLHRQFESIAAPTRHDVPPRIQAHIQKAFPWYYDLYYPKTVSR